MSILSQSVSQSALPRWVALVYLKHFAKMKMAAETKDVNTIQIKQWPSEESSGIFLLQSLPETQWLRAEKWN